MVSQFYYTAIRNTQDEQAIAKLTSQCFGGTPEEMQPYITSLGTDSFRLLCQDEEVLGSLAIYQMGQWYEGQRVPMAGIAAVGITPQYRGKGVAYELLKQTIFQLQQLKTPISVLYPATQVLYRKVGYEQGGSLCYRQLATAGLKLSDYDLPMYEITPDSTEIFQAIYTQRAKLNNGNLDRPPAIWQQILKEPDKQPIYAYLIGEKTEPEGYAIFIQKQESEKFTLILKDWVILTERAAKRFWSFIAAHRSQITHVNWRGNLIEPSLLILPERTAKITHLQHWMIRIIDVANALSKRGYSPAIEGELHLEVTDNLLETNNRRFCLQVSQGKAEVKEGGKGDFQIDIRGLGSLYSGFLSAYQLQLMGYLKATPESLATATMLFSGSNPWMADFF